MLPSRGASEATHAITFYHPVDEQCGHCDETKGKQQRCATHDPECKLVRFIIRFVSTDQTHGTEGCEEDEVCGNGDTGEVDADGSRVLLHVRRRVLTDDSTQFTAQLVIVIGGDETRASGMS